MNKYFRVGAVISALLLTCALLIAVKVVVLEWLHEAGVHDYDHWVAGAGIIIVLLIGRFFMGRVILECERGWPQAFRGDRTKWPFR